MQSVIHTPSFLADAEAAGIAEDELVLIEAVIAADPLAGGPVAGTGGARRLQFGGNGEGKSGGSRTITYFAAKDAPVFLLALAAKDQLADIGQADRDALRKSLRALAGDYQKDLRAAQQRSATKAQGKGAAKPLGKGKP